jgi:large subunit ribosomal protein L22
MIKASITNLRQSPRKVRLVADLIRGKKVAIALNEVKLTVKKASGPFEKLINSAVANAKNLGLDTEDLYVKEVRVDKGIVMKRYMPAAHGSAHPFEKRMSHVSIVLEETPWGKKAVKKEAKKEEVSKPKVKKLSKAKKLEPKS